MTNNLFSTHFVRANANEGSSIELAAKRSLEEIIEHGGQRTTRVIERIETEFPEDRIVKTHEIEPEATWAGVDLCGSYMGHEFEGVMHQNALSQYCERINAPRAYVRDLLSAAPLEVHGQKVNAWQHNLADQIIREHHAHTSPARWLLRSYNGQHRAVLSDKYRRLDSRPLLDAFMGECIKVGARPVEGLSNEVKCSVRAIIPKVYEPIPGEYMVLGMSWNNSDYGAGSYAVNFFAMRLLCKNGMVGESNIKQVHLGGRLPDSLVFSQETYDSDTRTMASATRDVVQSLLAPAAIDRRLAIIAGAAEKEISTDQAIRSVRNHLNKGEVQEVKRLFDSKDDLMLPAGKTKWRLSNALSWLANQDNVAPERKIDLQSLAGKVAA